jgi:hypothetical protein
VQSPQQLKLDLGLDEAQRYHSTDRYGYFSIFYFTGKLNAAGYRNHRQESYLLRDMPAVLSSLSGTEDTYLSQSEFKKPNRRTANFLRSGLSHVDLDYYNIQDVAFRSPEQILDRVFALLSAANVPLPNLALDSGRGLQLKWIYNSPIPDRALKRWQLVQEHLVKLLLPLGADMNAKDASRILRLAGTFNSKSRTMVRSIYESPDFYAFDDLANAVLPFTRNELADLKRQRAEAKQRKIELVADNPEIALTPSGLKKKGLGSLNWQRFLDLRQLCEQREGIEEGQRMYMLMYQVNFLMLSGASNPQQIWNEIVAVSRTIDPSWAPDYSDLSTVLEKAKAHFRGERVEFAGREWTPLYTPRNQTLIDLFGIESDEEQKLHTIISTGELKRRDRERHATMRRASGSVTRDEYERNSLSSRKPWEKLGVSRATWYRMGNPSA